LYPELYRSGGESRPEIADFGIKWGWYQNIYQLAKGDIQQFNKVVKLRLHDALMYLSFEADKNKLENKMLKRK